MSSSTALPTVPAADEARRTRHAGRPGRRPMALNSLRAGLFVLAALTCWAAFALVVDAPSQPGDFMLAIMVGLASEVGVAWWESHRA